MKNLLWFSGFGIFAVGLIALGWFHFGARDARTTTNTPSQQGTLAPSNFGPKATSAPSVLITPGEFQKYRAVRDAVLKSNPELAAEFEELKREQLIQQAQLDEATIKADPKVALIVAKIVEQRQQSFDQSSPKPVTR